MGKTGTTNEFKDALFVGSTYGADGFTVAVRIGFDDNRSLGANETGGRVALPVFQELMLRMYRDKIVGPVPSFPPQMEQHITQYVQGDAPVVGVDMAQPLAGPGAPVGHASPAARPTPRVQPATAEGAAAR
jgi:membrane carboxypeptidase/penicillin-binding protein